MSGKRGKQKRKTTEDPSTSNMPPEGMIPEMDEIKQDIELAKNVERLKLQSDVETIQQQQQQQDESNRPTFEDLRKQKEEDEKKLEGELNKKFEKDIIINKILKLYKQNFPNETTFFELADLERTPYEQKLMFRKKCESARNDSTDVFSSDYLNTIIQGIIQSGISFGNSFLPIDYRLNLEGPALKSKELFNDTFKDLLLEIKIKAIENIRLNFTERIILSIIKYVYAIHMINNGMQQLETIKNIHIDAESGISMDDLDKIGKGKDKET